MKIDDKIIKEQFSEIANNCSYIPETKSVFNKISVVIKGKDESKKLIAIVAKLIAYVNEKAKDKTEDEIVLYVAKDIHKWSGNEDDLLKIVNKDKFIEMYVFKLIRDKLLEIGNKLDNQYKLILDIIDGEVK